MRQQVEKMVKMLGLDIVASDSKSDYEKYGYIIIKSFNDTYLKVTFYQDSYDDGYIEDMKIVKPKPVSVVEYE